MVILQISRKLLLAPFVILIPMPDFKLNDKLLPQIIHDYIRTPRIPRLRLDIIVPRPVDDRFQVQQEKFASVGFNKFLMPVSSSSERKYS